LRDGEIPENLLESVVGPTPSEGVENGQMKNEVIIEAEKGTWILQN